MKVYKVSYYDKESQEHVEALFLNKEDSEKKAAILTGSVEELEMSTVGLLGKLAPEALQKIGAEWI